MSHAKRRLLSAVMAATVGIGVSAAVAQADDASTQQMQQKIDQLESKVKNLESNQAQSQADVTAAIQQVVADADKNSQLFDSVGTGTGYDPATGFHIGTDDGKFYFHPFALFQFEGVFNYRGGVEGHGVSPDAPSAGTNFNNGFTVRRLKIGADGHIFSPNTSFFMMLDTNHVGGGVSLDDAYLSYKVCETWPLYFQAGQFKDIVWHESNVSDWNQLAVDESLMNALIGGTMGGSTGIGEDQARVQGVMLKYDDGVLRGEVALHDGYDTANTPFFDTRTTIAAAAPGAAGIGALPPTNWGFSSRAEYKIMGDDSSWAEYDQFSAMGDKSDLLVAGGGFDYTEAGDDSAFFWSADVQYENAASGLGAYGALLGQVIRDPSGAAAGPGAAAVKTTANNYGWLVQGSYMITPQWEGFARYDFTHLDGKFYNVPLGITNHNLHEMTVGVNYYLFGQNAKFTVDASYLPSGSPLDIDGLGYLAQSPNHPEWVGRAMFQLKI